MFNNILKASVVGLVLSFGTISGCALVNSGPQAVSEAYEYADTLEEQAFVVVSQYRIFESFVADVLLTEGIPYDFVLNVVDVLRTGDKVALEVEVLATSLDDPTQLALKIEELVSLINLMLSKVEDADVKVSDYAMSAVEVANELE